MTAHTPDAIKGVGARETHDGAPVGRLYHREIGASLVLTSRRGPDGGGTAFVCAEQCGGSWHVRGRDASAVRLRHHGSGDARAGAICSGYVPVPAYTVFPYLCV